MGKGGGSQPQQVTSTTTTSNLPEYAQPYYQNLMDRAQAQSYQPYVPYQDQRVAGFTQDQQQAQQGIMNLQAPGQYGTATNLATQAGLASLTAGQYNPSQFNAQQVLPYFAQYLQAAGPGNFDNAAAQQYMSPYWQQALQPQMDEAIRDAQKTQLGANLDAARLGTYGGSRQLLAQTERERALGQNLSNIMSTGAQNAYSSAQQQFNADRAAQQQTALANLQAALQTQGLNAQDYMQAALANQDKNLSAQQLAEQSRQFGSQQGLAGLAQALQSSQILGTLGGQQQQAALDRLNAQNQVGQQQQALQQQQLDTAYGDFLRQRDYPMEQLSYFSNLMHGVPIGLESQTTAYAPPPSTASQVGGLGLGALSLYNLAGGKT